MGGRKKYRPARITILIIVVCSAGLFVGAAGYWSAIRILEYAKSLVSSASAINTVEVTFDKIYSPKLRKNLIQYLEKKTIGTNLLSFAFEAFYSDVKAAFAMVENIECNQIAPSSIHVHIEGFQPAYRINKDWIAGSDGSLMNKKCYTEFEVDALPHVFVTQLQSPVHVLEKDVQKFLNNLDQSWLHDFTCEYRSNDEVLFIAKNMKQVHRFVVTADQVESKLNLATMTLIVDDLICKKQLASWQKVVFDFRFKNRIITRKIRKSRRG